MSQKAIKQSETGFHSEPGHQVSTVAEFDGYFHNYAVFLISPLFV